MKEATLKRKTSETEIYMNLKLDGFDNKLTGTTGIGFFDHMLNSFCVHGGFNINLEMKGDLHVDAHHTVEDTAIVLGKLFAEVLFDKTNIKRFGEALIPMDESLAGAVVDISGRPYLVYNVPPLLTPILGGYDTQLTVEFFRALTFNMGATIHIKLYYGENTHHITEAVFKAAARAISEAISLRGSGEGQILSAKGVL